VREQVTGVLSHIEIRVQRPEDAEVRRTMPKVQELHPDPGTALGGNGTSPSGLNGGWQPADKQAAVDRADPATWAGASRNAPCPCGSGRKYKYCHGKIGTSPPA